MSIGKFLPTGARIFLKGRYKRARTQFVRTRYAYSPADLARMIDNLGVSAGGTLMVHSSMDALSAFTGTAQDVIGVLRAAVGDSGHLMMPNQPFRSTAVDFAKTGAMFDVRRTPSAAGLLTELYRRSEGVVRSVHPTHPIAVAGPRTHDLIRDAHKTDTPCGRGSVYHIFGAENGLILLLGVSIDVMTYYHCLEEELESRMPFSPFTDEFYTMRSRCHDGREVKTKLRLFNPRVSAARRLSRVVPYLRSRDALREERAGNLVARLVPSSQLRAAVHEMADDGVFCYDI